jgi:hypothetical protein
MARDSRNRTGRDDIDADSVSAGDQPASGGVVTLDVEDGKLIDHDTGEEIVTELPTNELLPDWLWEQHNSGPPPEEPKE